MANVDFLKQTLSAAGISRRGFLKWSAVLGGTAILANGGLTELKNLPAAFANGTLAPKEGKWVTAACWTACGSRCLNKVYVVDGVIVRQKTDDTHADTPDYPQMRGCLKGRSLRRVVQGVDRLKYPMKRKNWAPGGGKKELRGKDEWVRISWDEALDIVASELKRIKEKYGNKSILSTLYYGDPRISGWYDGAVLHAYGGNVSTWGEQSLGAFPVISTKMYGSFASGANEGNDRMDLRNAKLIVLWGANPAWTCAGNATYHLLNAKRAGAKVIFVDPFYSPTARSLADQWVPVRPGTDVALLLAIGHHMITNHLQDQAFLDKYTVGFDKDHMPAGVNPEENFKDYVLGTYDGVPKTPEWASQICGTAPSVIRDLAQQMATIKPMSLRSAFSPARTESGMEYVQAFYTVGWMTGNVGIPGGCVTPDGSPAAIAEDAGPALVSEGAAGVTLPLNPICEPPRGGGLLPKGIYDPQKFYGISYSETWTSIVNGEFTNFVHGKEPINIQMIWKLGVGGRFNQTPNTKTAIEAFRKVEFAVSSDLWFTSDCRYSDVVLPAVSPWELNWGTLTGNREILIVYGKVAEPPFETREDGWMEREIARRLGLDPEVVVPSTLKQVNFNKIAGAQVAKEDGSGMEPLVTITAADLAEFDVQAKPQTGRIPLKELMDKGIYQIKRAPDDKFTYIAFKAFREDPVKNPVKTASGKLEIHCQAAVDALKVFNYSVPAPIAKYNGTKQVEGYEQSFVDWNAKIKGCYPLQMVTPHYLGRSHTAFANNPYLREAYPQEVFINTLDAAERGITNGEAVLLTSPRGSVLRPAYVTDAIMPGVVSMAQGAWTEMDEQMGIDKSGNPNTLDGVDNIGEGFMAYNSVLVQAERWKGDPLTPDARWARRIPLTPGAPNG